MKMHTGKHTNAPNKTQAQYVATATGCKGLYAFTRMPGHNRMKQSVPDAMHTLKDVVKNVMDVCTGRVGNLDKIITSEQHRQRTHIIEVPEEEASSRISPPTTTSSDDPEHPTKKRKVFHDSQLLPFVLTQNELSIADRRANSIQLPIGMGTKPSSFISKTSSLKSHDWKELAAEGIL